MATGLLDEAINLTEAKTGALPQFSSGQAGARIHEGARVRRIRHGARPVLETDGGTVSADTVLICTDGLLEGVDSTVEAHVAPIANHIATTAPLGDRLREVLTSRAAVSDSRFVVYYYRPTPDGRTLHVPSKSGI